jgi:tetratricopeptide (TPR) repeat protein
MFGHDLRRTGQIENAIAHFEHTRTLEEEYYRAEGISPDYDWHHAHNLSLLATAYQYQGRMRSAEELSRRVFTIPAHMAVFDLARREWPELLLRRGRSAEALAAAREMQHAPEAGVRAVGHALAGQALAAGGHLKAAEAELADAREELANTAGRGPLPLTPALVQPHVDALEAELLLRTDRRERARAIFESVTTRLRTMPGADAWIAALFRIEAIARVARDADDWTLAEYAARQMLEHDPSYAGSHYAVALVAAERQDAATARRELDEAIALWKQADADLPELADARRRLAELER